MAHTIIPAPRSITSNNENFQLQADAKILFNGGLAKEIAELLADYLRPSTGFEIPIENGSSGSGNIILQQTGSEKQQEAPFTDESYTLNTTADGLIIAAPGDSGLARGIQTLRQLFPTDILSSTVQNGIEWTIPGVDIIDSPDMQWRGMHLDVARHFFSAKEVCRFIDSIALHRYNILHWHLTEDQGWRIEIKQYPKLTEIGSIREKTLVGHYKDKPHQYDNTPYGGFYTQEEIQEVVAYAAQRRITIVPEIDMPGHMQAAIAAYPELGNNPDHQLKLRWLWGISYHILNPAPGTIIFMQNVLQEVMDLFPAPYIHIGGDEAHKDEWQTSEYAHTRMRELGLKDEHELQSWFIKQMDEFITAAGRRLIGWDEILEGGLADNAAVMSWRGKEGGIKAARQGHAVVMADNNFTYFDHYQAEPTSEEPLGIGGYLPTEKVYAFNPVPEELTEEEGKHVMGGQGQLWSEYMKTYDHVEYMAYPRTCALAEVLWGKPEGSNYTCFLNRLKTHRKRLEAAGINAHPRP